MDEMLYEILLSEDLKFKSKFYIIHYIHGLMRSFIEGEMTSK